MSDAPRKVGSYTIESAIGRGSQGQTYRARDPDGEVVVVKELNLRSMAAWKSLELFEREITTLRVLAHPDIPRFIDAIREDDRCLLVQEFVDGEPLDRVGTLTDAELKALGRDVLGVLHYLHTLVPPVIHRDVKPSNIIRRPDGTHALVDFGGVQNIVASDTGGSTVVGTSGYMPPEQLVGRAMPQSDLYALAATLVHLATGRRPDSLPTKRLKLDWRGHVTLPPDLDRLVDQMLEPAPEDRPESAAAALSLLTGTTPLVHTFGAQPPTRDRHPPQRTRSMLIRPRAPIDRSALDEERVALRMRRSHDALVVDLGRPPRGNALGVLVIASIILLPGVGVLVAVGILIVLALAPADPAQEVRIESDGTTMFTNREGGRPSVEHGALRLIKGGQLMFDSGPNTHAVSHGLAPAELEMACAHIADFLDEAQRGAPLPPLPAPAPAPVTTDEAQVQEPEALPAPQVEPLYYVPPEAQLQRLESARAHAVDSRRPGGTYPRGLVARFDVNESRLRVKLGARIRRATVWGGLAFLALGAIVTAATSNPVPVIAGFIAMVFYIWNAALGGRKEVLTITPDGAFEYRFETVDARGDAHMDSRSGTLLPQVDAGNGRVRIFDRSGDPVHISSWIDRDEHEGLAHEIQHYLQHGRLSDALARDER